ncbi:uncharacterized protein METZ01_LOCUS16803, partial [marine metagenome]
VLTADAERFAYIRDLADHLMGRTGLGEPDRRSRLQVTAFVDRTI